VPAAGSIEVQIGSNGSATDAFLRGRAEAAAHYPWVHEEGFREGWAAHRNELARRLRALARDDPTARSLLIEVLDG
jgi:hypothetical protein